jgi:hypothetical protein
MLLHSCIVSNKESAVNLRPLHQATNTSAFAIVHMTILPEYLTFPAVFGWHAVSTRTTLLYLHSETELARGAIGGTTQALLETPWLMPRMGWLGPSNVVMACR